MMEVECLLDSHVMPRPCEKAMRWSPCQCIENMAEDHGGELGVGRWECIIGATSKGFHRVVNR